MADGMDNTIQSSPSTAADTVPALNHGVQILNEIRAIKQRLVDVEEDIRGISTRAEAVDYNVAARLANNAQAKTVGSQLAPLRTPQNQDVDNFPIYLGDIDKLSSANLNVLLTRFNLSVEGTVAIRRRRFKMYIGIFIVAT